MAQYTLELFDNEYTLYFMYFTKVTNAIQLKENAEKFECAFINPSLVCSITQILLAVNRSLFNKFTNKTKTQTIYSDIVNWSVAAGTEYLLRKIDTKLEKKKGK